MTTITYEQRPVNLMPLLVIILLAVGLASVGVAYSHAVIKHGADAEVVRECLNRNGHMQLWAHDDWEHRARVCEVEPGVFGIQVVKLIGGKWEEITAYIPRQATGGIAKYLEEIGYRLVWSAK